MNLSLRKLVRLLLALALLVCAAPAGCGKTYQGARYAARAAIGLETGRVLILTHTHAACGAFAKATNHDRRKVEISTIDSLIVRIAAAYHRSRTTFDARRDLLWLGSH